MGDSNLFEVIEGDYTYPPFSNFQNDYTYPPQDFQDIEEVVEIVEIPSVMNRVRGAEIIDSPDMSGMSQQDIIDLYYSNNDDYDTNNYPTYSDLLLIKPCTDHLLRKFYVKLVLDDGAIYQDSTQIIKLF